ncbi:sensor histidine kinase [Cohnella ginsengisoli]|uniref:histidine kinase n=1 Tax=Cohnella ginsengisoli TaxID=425004 RepID=A0A9X4KLN4_9BACL|nr:sensor histidine kinase [Cohnella ginsengisoli]MDG0792722.1 sensor histidine kinase [Cohnella ginsengisoli]
MFEKFYRADATRQITGTGLGLAICKGIVELHGGTISARRNEPQGTVVTIALPLSAADEPRERPKDHGTERDGDE